MEKTDRPGNSKPRQLAAVGEIVVFPREADSPRPCESDLKRRRTSPLSPRSDALAEWLSTYPPSAVSIQLSIGSQMLPTPMATATQADRLEWIRGFMGACTTDQSILLRFAVLDNDGADANDANDTPSDAPDTSRASGPDGSGCCGANSSTLPRAKPSKSSTLVPRDLRIVPSNENVVDLTTSPSAKSTRTTRHPLALPREQTDAPPPPCDTTRRVKYCHTPPFTRIDANLYHADDDAWTLARNLLPKPRERPDIECDCHRMPNRYKEPMCNDLQCHNVTERIVCPPTCRMYDLCMNQGFLPETMEALHEVFDTQVYGLGVRATSDLPPGKFVMEYVGEVIGRNEFQRRFDEARVNGKGFYFMELRWNVFIDAALYGNNARFINHSCNPNCDAELWVKDGVQRVAIVTTKEIKSGDEICFSYGWSPLFEEFNCLCGAANCRYIHA